jgi:hypothetical protein
VLTLRTVKDLQRIFSSSTTKEYQLAKFLLDKIPTLGEFTCLEFATSILQLYDKMVTLNSIIVLIFF